MICARRETRFPGNDTEFSRLHLNAVLTLPRRARGLAVVVQGRGHRSPSPFQRALADRLRAGGIGTCLVDLLDASEIEPGAPDAQYDLDFLAERLESVIDFLAVNPDTWQLPLGIVGIDAAAPAALMMAAERPELVRAVVACCGRPEEAPVDFSRLTVPTLLIAPSADPSVLAAHESVFLQLQCTSQLAVIRGAGRRLAEPGSMVACEQAVNSWCCRYLRRSLNASLAFPGRGAPTASADPG